MKFLIFLLTIMLNMLSHNYIDEKLFTKIKVMNMF